MASLDNTLSSEQQSIHFQFSKLQKLLSNITDDVEIQIQSIGFEFETPNVHLLIANMNGDITSVNVASYNAIKERLRKNSIRKHKRDNCTVSMGIDQPPFCPFLTDDHKHHEQMNNAYGHVLQKALVKEISLLNKNKKFIKRGHVSKSILDGLANTTAEVSSMGTFYEIHAQDRRNCYEHASHLEIEVLFKKIAREDIWEIFTKAIDTITDVLNETRISDSVLSLSALRDRTQFIMGYVNPRHEINTITYSPQITFGITLDSIPHLFKHIALSKITSTVAKGELRKQYDYCYLRYSNIKNYLDICKQNNLLKLNDLKPQTQRDVGALLFLILWVIDTLEVINYFKIVNPVPGRKEFKHINQAFTNMTFKKLVILNPRNSVCEIYTGILREANMKERDKIKTIINKFDRNIDMFYASVITNNYDFLLANKMLRLKATDLISNKVPSMDTDSNVSNAAVQQYNTFAPAYKKINYKVSSQAFDFHSTGLVYFEFRSINRLKSCKGKRIFSNGNIQRFKNTVRNKGKRHGKRTIPPSAIPLENTNTRSNRRDDCLWHGHR